MVGVPGGNCNPLTTSELLVKSGGVGIHRARVGAAPRVNAMLCFFPPQSDPPISCRARRLMLLDASLKAPTTYDGDKGIWH